MNLRLQVQLAAQEAGRQGRPNPVPRSASAPDDLAQFHAWHLANVERELGQKLLPAAPAADVPDLMICRPKPAKGDEL